MLLSCCAVCPRLNGEGWLIVLHTAFADERFHGQALHSGVARERGQRLAIRQLTDGEGDGLIRPERNRYARGFGAAHADGESRRNQPLAYGRGVVPIGLAVGRGGIELIFGRAEAGFEAELAVVGHAVFRGGKVPAANGDQFSAGGYGYAAGPIAGTGVAEAGDEAELTIVDIRRRCEALSNRRRGRGTPHEPSPQGQGCRREGDTLPHSEFRLG